MKLTKKAFRKWLESKKAHCTVGYSRLFDGCPLAAYCESLGHSPDAYGDVIPAPAWMLKFIEGVDDLPRFKPVTAARALRILDGEE